MKPAFAILPFAPRRLPLTLASVCLGIGSIGLAATLYQPVGLSPFSAPRQPRVVAEVSTLEPFIMPEAPVIEVVQVAETPAPEAPARAAIFARPESLPAPEPPAEAPPVVPTPDAAPAGDGEATPLPDYLPVAPPDKDKAGAPPGQYYNPNANPLPLPPGIPIDQLPPPGVEEAGPQAPLIRPER